RVCARIAQDMHLTRLEVEKRQRVDSCIHARQDHRPKARPGRHRHGLHPRPRPGEQGVDVARRGRHSPILPSRAAIDNHLAHRMTDPREPDSITYADVVAARRRLDGTVPRTPLVRLEGDGPGEMYLKLDTLQPIRSFKLRGAFNAMAMLDDAALAAGVYTASAGNMAQGVAWSARRRGVRSSVVVPDNAPKAKIAAIRRLGAEIISVPYDEWWSVMAAHRYAPLEPAHFIHPSSDVAVMAGNGTIGLEILDDVPDVDAVIVPFGGGGLSCGIAAGMQGIRQDERVYGCEVETAAPLAAALAADRVVECERTPTFVDGIGSRSMLKEMWA